MCGLFGIAGPGIQQADVNNFIDLGIISQLRGEEGAGIWQTKTNCSRNIRNHQERWYKTSGSFQDLLREIKVLRGSGALLNSIAVDVLMGHVRHPTRGSNTDDNAHPFVYANMVGMHNGTLKDREFQSKDQTDSELMFEEISNREGDVGRSMEVTLKALDKSSAYAIALYDREREYLYFARNEKRTLAFAFLEDRNVMYWASEIGMLNMILKRKHIKFQAFTLNTDNIIRIDPWNISKTKGLSNLQMVADWSVKKEEKKEEVKTSVIVTAPETKTEIVKVEAPKVAEDKETKKDQSSNVIPLKGKGKFHRTESGQLQLTSKGQQVLSRAFSNSCVCGEHKLNIHETYLAKQNDGRSRYTYDPTTGSIYCESCLNNIDKGKVSNV